MLPAPFSARSPVAVALLPVLELPAVVAPAASKSFHHVAGQVKGAQVLYFDLNACAWYVSGGWEYRNGRNLARRGLSGHEDTDERKQ